MFKGASSFNCDLSEWIVIEHTDVFQMFSNCPCDDFTPVWEERRQVQKAKDECWERRLPWMVANAPYLQGERRTEAPIQMVYDIHGLFEFITTYIKRKKKYSQSLFPLWGVASYYLRIVCLSLSFSMKIKSHRKAT